MVSLKKCFLFITSLTCWMVAVSFLNDPAFAAQPPTDDAWNVEFVGQTGGQMRAVAMQGDYIYVGEGPRLTILHIDDLYGYTVEGQTRPLTGIIMDIYVVGNYAYVVDGNLWVIDVSDVTNPVPVGYYETDSYAFRVTSNGQHSFILDGYDSLAVIDVSDPTKPVRINDYNNYYGSDFFDIDLFGGYIYLSDEEEGVRIFDISSPAIPTQIGCYPARAYAFSGQDTYGYVIDNSIGKMVVIDLSNLTNPTAIGTYQLSDFAQDMTTVRNKVYLAYVSRGFDIVDISSPTSPTLIRRDNAVVAKRITAKDSYVLVTDLNSGLNIINTSNGSYNRLPYTRPANPENITIANDHAYIGYRTDGELYSYTDRAGDCSPLLSFQEAPDEEPALLSYQESPQETQASVAANWGLGVMNVSDPSNLNNQYSYTIPSTDIITEVDGQHLYASGDDLYSLDISVPTYPSQVGFYGTPTKLKGLDFSEQNAYIAGDDSLHILDISNPAHPTKVGQLEFSREEYEADITVFSNYAYVASTPSKELKIFDISSPAHPKVVKSFYAGSSSYWQDIATFDNYLFAGSGECFFGCLGNLYVFDISNPIDPVQLYSFNSIGAVRELLFKGSYLYVATSTDGVKIFDVSAPATPVQVGYYDSPDYALDLGVSGDHIFVANYRAGIYSLRPNFVITGRVSHANGLPFENLTISAGGGLTTSVNSDGGFIFTDLPDNTYTLSPNLPDTLTSLPLNRTATAFPAAGQSFVILPKPMTVTLQPGQSTTVSYEDTFTKTTTFTFPANAVLQPTTIVITPTVASPENAHSVFTGHAFEIAAYQNNQFVPEFEFKAPIEISIAYSDQDIRQVANERQMALLHQETGQWQETTEGCQPDSTYTQNIEDNELEVSLCQTGLFGLFGPRFQTMYFPIIHRSEP